MDGDAGAGEPQAGGAAQPQAGTAGGGQEPPAGNGQAPAAGAPSESNDERLARLERELSEARKEAAGYRTKAGALEREKAERAQAGMTEAEREKARAAALEEENKTLAARLRQQGLEQAAMAAASKLNFRNPELAVRLLNPSEIEYDESTGQPKNVQHLLKHLSETDPYLVKSANGADYGGGRRGEPPSTEPGMNELLHAALRR